MFDLVKSFADDQSAAVTVDWVLLTAATCGIAIAALLVIAPGLNPVAAKVEPATQDAPGLGASMIAN